MTLYRTFLLVMLSNVLLSACSHKPNSLALQGAMDEDTIFLETGALKEKVILQQMEIRTTEDQYLQALISLKNTVDNAIPVAYKVEWLDTQQKVLRTQPNKWYPFILGAKERQVILTTSPHKQATAYRFRLRPETQAQ